MKKLLILISAFVSFSAKSNTICQKGELSLKQNKSHLSWEFSSSSDQKKWIFIKNLDNGKLYPKKELKETKGSILNIEFEKNKKGYSFIVMEVSKEESMTISSNLKNCSLKNDCALKTLLNRCVLAEKKI